MSKNGTCPSSNTEAAADCLYEIGEAVWCGLVVDKSSGVLMGLDCRQITLAHW